MKKGLLVYNLIVSGFMAILSIGNLIFIDNSNVL